MEVMLVSFLVAFHLLKSITALHLSSREAGSNLQLKKEKKR